MVLFSKTNLNKGEIHIWKALVSAHQDRFHYYWDFLSLDERERANEFYFDKDKIHYIIARGILREIISRYVKVFPQELQFLYSEYGKPYLIERQNTKSVYFNLSHSEDCIVYAFSKDKKIGVDVEQCKEDFDWAAVGPSCFVEPEYKKAQSLSEEGKRKYFYTLWTLKEAFIKAVGQGVHLDLKHFSVDLDIDKRTAKLHFEKDFLAEVEIEENWTLQVFQTYVGYQAAFAVQQRVQTIEYFDVATVQF